MSVVSVFAVLLLAAMLGGCGSNNSQASSGRSPQGGPGKPMLPNEGASETITNGQYGSGKNSSNGPGRPMLPNMPTGDGH